MIEVSKGVFVANQASGCIRAEVPGKAFVHACKQPCHQRAVGYRGSLLPSHPLYLGMEQGNHLYLNLVDAQVPIFRPGSFPMFRDFARRQYRAGSELVIHCNQGESRAPSLALLFLAKDLKVLPADSFDAARLEFEKLYPGYSPGRGIELFMRQHWPTL